MIAVQLNQQGIHPTMGAAFTAKRVALVRRTYHLKTRFQRLREAGLLTLKEIAQHLKVCTKTVQVWRDHGLLRAHTFTDKGECLYEPTGPNPPQKQQGLACPLCVRKQFLLNATNEVQYEA